MKVVEIKENNSNAFKGLWGQGENKSIRVVQNYSIQETETIPYHPFYKESQEVTNKKINSKFFDIIIPINNGSVNKRSIRKAVLAKPLSFTKEEFQSYKNFYGRKLPEKFAMIEKELANLGLEHYINSGFIYSCKKWLHNIVRI